MIEVSFSSLSYTQFDRRKVRAAMGKAARLIAKALKASIGKRSGSGRVYRRGRRNYTASAPGHPPVRFTSNLWRSVKGRPSRRGYAMIVETTAPHSHLLELGTRRSAARPSFAAALGNNADAIQGLLREAIGSGLTVTAGSPGQPPKSVEIG